MGKRLVLKFDETETDLGVLSAFVETAKKYGIKNGDKVAVSNEVRFSVDVPKDVTIVSGEAVKVKRKTKKTEAVEKQIADHKEKKENGEKEAYVPPVGRTTPPPVKKLKCPECNVRKQVVTVAGVKSIRPHTIKGNPCPGSGTQVLTRAGAEKKWSKNEEKKEEEA